MKYTEEEKNMTVLLVGATGATGRLLVEELLRRNHRVRVIVRTPEKLSEAVRNHPLFTIVQTGILDLSDVDLVHTVQDCTGIPISSIIILYYFPCKTLT